MSEFAIFTFVTGAVDTMSHEVVPYLLALWDEWEDSDSDIEYAIQDALDDYFMIRNYRRRKQTEEEVEEFMVVSKRTERTRYPLL